MRIKHYQFLVPAFQAIMMVEVVNLKYTREVMKIEHPSLKSIIIMALYNVISLILQLINSFCLLRSRANFQQV